MELTRQKIRVQARRFILEILNSSEGLTLKSSVLVSKVREEFLKFYKNKEDDIDFLYNFFEKQYSTGESFFNGYMHWEMTALNLGHAGFVDTSIRGVRVITELCKKFLADFGDSKQSDFVYFHGDNICEWLQKNASEQWAKSRFNKDREKVVGKVETPREAEETVVSTIDKVKQDRDKIEEDTKEILKEAIAIIGNGDKHDRGKKVEALAQKVFEKMGYSCVNVGANSPDKMKEGSGDGGIDMLISLDKLSLNQIPVQVKGYAGKTSVPSKEIREFAGAIKAISREGIFITTTAVSKKIKIEAFDKNIILIDIDKLVELMIKHNIGVSFTNITLYEKDSDFFEEFY